MKRLLAPAALLAGACLAVVGLWWVWTGLDIVQIERGWTAVIAGATMFSAGLVLAGLAAVLLRLGEIADALRKYPLADATAAAIPTAKQTEQRPTSDPGPSPESSSEVVGRHVSGDTTYVMFADGSVEALTPEGVVTFASLDALRAYAEQREAASERGAGVVNAGRA